MIRYLLCSCAFLVFASELFAHSGQGGYRNIEFVENRGQWDGPFSYKAITTGADIYLAERTFTYVIGDPANAARLEACKNGLQPGPAILNFHAYRMHFEGASIPRITGSKQQQHYYNYFLGNDPRRWQSGIHPFLVLDYQAIYPGIDLHLASEEGRLKYDFIVNPGADPSTIRLRFEGIEGLSVRSGKLQISTSVGTVTEHAPYAYQHIDGEKREVVCRYKVRGNEVTYTFPQGYNQSHPLIIDPVVEFSTFTGSVSDNWGFTATYDSDGNFYAGGAVAGSNYPTTTGAYSQTYSGGGTGGGNGTSFPCDIAITKFNRTGNALLYSTFVGGRDNDQPHSMIVDEDNNLVVSGRTYSDNFPVTKTAFDTSFNGNADIVVLKLNSAGSALLASTYMGGTEDDGVNVSSNWSVTGVSLKHSYGDDARSEVIVDKRGNIYVAAATRSADFPRVHAVQNIPGSTQDGVAFKFNRTLDTLMWSTYMGGLFNDAAYVLALDTAEAHVYVAGGTESFNFPAVAGGLWSSFQGGSSDGFILKFENGNNYPLVKSTFIGTSDYDQCFGIQVDLEDNVYVMGNTLGGTFPVTPGVYNNPGSSQFVMKLNPDLSNNLYSTVFGSGNSSAINITPIAFLVDTCQNVYISGWGGPLAGTGSSTAGLPVTGAPNPAFQSTTDGADLYFFALSKNAIALLYGSFFGGTGLQEHVDGGTSRFDRNGVVYQSICGGCWGQSGVPTTPGAFSRTNGSTGCNLVAVKIAFNLGAVKAEAKAEPDAKGCLPFTVQFQNQSANAISFDWDFGDGTPGSTLKEPSHTFNSPGVFTVRMAAYNPNACKVWDTAYLTVTVDTNRMFPDFDFTLVDTCDPFRVDFRNTSGYSLTPGASDFTTFDWFFGDGTSYSGDTPSIHTYPGPGTYTVTMVMYDSTACNHPDTVKKTVTIPYPLVQARWQVPDSICINDTASFFSTSSNATSILWSFGDGNTATVDNPTHKFQTPGTYRITFKAMNPATCNRVDSLTKVIYVRPAPTAFFEYEPKTPITNMPTRFINKSSPNSIAYLWDFGDGGSSDEKHPVHQYRRTDGRFQVCLTVISAEGCADTFCREVEADIRPLVDVPSAFSPNGDGNNDILYVRGGAIERIHFRIFNRWGELVFETTDINIGWDGTYKGVEQEMEVYAYTLTAHFTNGTTAYKQGNITLLR
jgi:gliding motility-associated-like protein